MGPLISFLLGFVLGAITPRAWVRGGAARALAWLKGFGSWVKDGAQAPTPTSARFLARETVPRETPRETVRPKRTNIPIDRALANIGRAFLRVLGFIATHPILAAGLVILVLGFFLWRSIPLPFEFAKSKEALRAERDAARVEAKASAIEAEIARRAVILAETTERDHARVEQILDQAEEQIADAVESADFDRLFIAYERAYLSVWDNVRPSDDDSAPGAIDGLRGFSANPA